MFKNSTHIYGPNCWIFNHFLVVVNSDIFFYYCGGILINYKCALNVKYWSIYIVQIAGIYNCCLKIPGSHLSETLGKHVGADLLHLMNAITQPGLSSAAVLHSQGSHVSIMDGNYISKPLIICIENLIRCKISNSQTK